MAGKEEIKADFRKKNNDLVKAWFKSKFEQRTDFAEIGSKFASFIGAGTGDDLADVKEEYWIKEFGPVLGSSIHKKIQDELGKGGGGGSDVVERITTVLQTMHQDLSLKIDQSLKPDIKKCKLSGIDSAGYSLIRGAFKWKAVDVPPPSSFHIGGLQWSGLREDQQKDQYFQLLKGALGIPNKDYTVIQAPQNMLNTSAFLQSRFGIPLELTGTSDVAVLSQLLRAGMGASVGACKLLIEVKKPEIVGQDDCIRQAVGETVAAAALCDNPPIVMLTDLSSQATFFWVDGDTLCFWHMKYPEAIATVKQLLSSAPSDLPMEKRKPVEEKKIKATLHDGGDDDDGDDDDEPTSQDVYPDRVIESRTIAKNDPYLRRSQVLRMARNTPFMADMFRTPVYIS